MKKVQCFFIVVLLLLLCGCKSVDTAFEQEKREVYINGVWLTYSELDKMLESDFKLEFEKVIKNCKERGITDMFVHIVPFCDAYYNSKIYPKRTSALSKDYDILKYMVDMCHKNNINFHAWINPYRVRTVDNNISALPEESPAKKWENTLNISTASGIYLNPASDDVRALIIDGVREIINDYDVDGIHFDDYFYPSSDESFDKLSYEEYQSNTTTPLSLADFRRANVNALVSGVYTTIKFKDKNIIFSISPSASIEENYNKQYADISAWCKGGIVDYIIPQLYFGFEYPDPKYNFENLLEEWKMLTKDTDVNLIIGLAAYKINTSTELDSAEWSQGTEIIKRQIEICKNDAQISGHMFFSYSTMKEFL